MPLSRINAQSLTDASIVSAEIADGAITTAKLADNAVTTAKVNPAQTDITSVGTLTNFRSTGIDDNADALAMTISSDEDVMIGTTDESSGAKFIVGNTSDDKRGFFQGSNQYRVGLKNASNNHVFIGSGGADNFRVSRHDGSTSLEVNGSGNIVLPVPSTGIHLGVTSATASNLLDDYEEGTWTPVVADANSGGNTGTYADNYSHKYIKIGNMVMITFSLFNINTSGMTGGNSFFVRGLPFNGVASGVYATNHVHFDSINTDATGATISGEVTSVGLFMDQLPHFRLFQYYDQSLASVKVQDLESGYADILGNLTYYTA